MPLCSSVLTCKQMHECANHCANARLRQQLCKQRSWNSSTNILTVQSNLMVAAIKLMSLTVTILFKHFSHLDPICLLWQNIKNRFTLRRTNSHHIFQEVVVLSIYENNIARVSGLLGTTTFWFDSMRFSRPFPAVLLLLHQRFLKCEFRVWLEN